MQVRLSHFRAKERAEKHRRAGFHCSVLDLHSSDIFRLNSPACLDRQPLQAGCRARLAQQQTRRHWKEQRAPRTCSACCTASRRLQKERQWQHRLHVSIQAWQRHATHAGGQTPKHQQAAGSFCWPAAAGLELPTRTPRAQCAGCCCRRRSCRRTYRRSWPCLWMTVHPGRPLAPRRLSAPADPAGRVLQQQQKTFRALAALARAAQLPQPSPRAAAALLRCPGPAYTRPRAQAAGPGSRAVLVRFVHGRRSHASLRMVAAELDQAECALSPRALRVSAGQSMRCIAGPVKVPLEQFGKPDCSPRAGVETCGGLQASAKSGVHMQGSSD